jgi:transposase
LFHHFNWQTIAVIAGLTLWNFYFDLFTETIRGPHVILFLEHLQRVIHRSLLVVWDGLPAHRSKLVSEYLRTLNDRVIVERLPPYAPEAESSAVHLGLPQAA